MVAGRMMPRRYVLLCTCLAACSNTAPLDPAVEAVERYEAAWPPDAVIVPVETSDRESLEALGDLSRLPALRAGMYAQQSSADRGHRSAVEETLIPLIVNGNRDLNQFICKSADADLVAPPWLVHRYDLPSCPDAYVRGAVAARFEGSGKLVRFWLTSTAIMLPETTLADEVLRIYVDDDPVPRVQVPLTEVMSGAHEIFAPPFGAGSHKYVAWYYPVVFSRKLVVALDHLTADYYHQSDVVLDPQPVARTAPPERLPERDLAIAQLTAAGPRDENARVLRSMHAVLGAGQREEVELPGPATVREFRVRVPNGQLSSLADTRVSVHWDRAPRPSIDLPLASLFASGQAVVARSNLVLAAEVNDTEHTFALRLPMPFRNHARWALHNYGPNPIDLQLEWIGDAREPEAQHGHLHVQHATTRLPALQLEQTIARATGPGRLVGMCADLAGVADEFYGFPPSPLTMLEGDLRATIDGRRALDGTGTEDYPDNAFYFLETPRATPFAQNWGVIDDWPEDPVGRASFCRWHVLGTELDFQSELSLVHEIAPRDPSIVTLHRTTTYLYQR